jgi:hypothetical protein
MIIIIIVEEEDEEEDTIPEDFTGNREATYVHESSEPEPAIIPKTKKRFKSKGNKETTVRKTRKYNKKFKRKSFSKRRKGVKKRSKTKIRRH